MYTEKEIAEFDSFLKLNSCLFAEMEIKRSNFISTFKDIDSLTLEDYCYGGSKDSFCHQLHDDLHCFGSIRDCGHTKFNIYFDSKNNRYEYQSRFSSPEEALADAKEGIQMIINGKMDQDNYHLYKHIKRKIDAIYHPNDHIFMYSIPYTKKICSSLNIPFSNHYNETESAILAYKNSHKIMKNWSNLEFMYFADSYFYQDIKGISNMYKLLNKEDDDGDVIEDKYKKVEYKIRESYRNGKKEYCTNPQIKTNALIKAGFLCELNNSHKTFIVEKGHQYVEGHHIIPTCKQDNYEDSVDVEDNIISLCPNCHREIHHAKDKSLLSKKIFDLRKDYLKSKGIKTPSMLKDLYK